MGCLLNRSKDNTRHACILYWNLTCNSLLNLLSLLSCAIHMASIIESQGVLMYTCYIVWLILQCNTIQAQFKGAFTQAFPYSRLRAWCFNIQWIIMGPFTRHVARAFNTAQMAKPARTRVLPALPVLAGY